MKFSVLTVCLMSAMAAGILLAADADARSKKLKQERVAVRDCTPFNGPSGYYGNPWCENGAPSYGYWSASNYSAAAKNSRARNHSRHLK